MIPRFCAIVFALVLSTTPPALAQQYAEAPSASSSPGVQSSQVPSNDKPQPKEDQRSAAGETPVLNSAEAPQDQKPGGNRAEGGNGVRADKSEHESYERIIANFTIALAVATFMLMIATGGLWWETRKLATQAIEASKDTKQSIEISERSADAAVRAANAATEGLATERSWIIFQGINAMPSRDARIDGILHERVFGVRSTWANSGRTPAINVKNHAQIRIIDIDDDLPTFELPPAFFEAAHAVIGPTHQSGSAPCGVAVADLERQLRGEIQIVLYAAVEYRTIFSDELKRSEVCGFLQHQGNVLGQDGALWPAIGFNLAGNQNSVS